MSESKSEDPAAATSWHRRAIGWGGAFTTTAVVVLVGEQLRVDGVVLAGLSGPMGASAVLVFGMPSAPVSQPRHLVAGHGLAATLGVLLGRMLAGHPPLAAGLGVAGALALMQLTGTMHPPAGGTAMLAIVGGAPVQALGYTYVALPVLAGAALVLLGAMATALLAGHRYPESWTA